MMPPRLNRLLVLETPARVNDGAGGYSQSWQPLGSLWAQLTSRSGNRAEMSESSVALVSYRITVRSAPEGSPARPRPGQRFREGERLFKINAVTDHDQEQRYLTCYAIEEVIA